MRAAVGRSKQTERNSVIAGFLTAALLCSCTYRAQIPPSDFSPPAPNVVLPLRVALLHNPGLRVKHFRAANGGAGVDIDLYPALLDAVLAQLRSLFATVDVLEVRPETGSNYDAFVRFDLEWAEAGRDAWQAILNYQTLTSLEFVDPKTLATISTYTHPGYIQYSPPTEATLASALTGLSLFVLSPITYPWAASAAGRHASDLISNLIESSVLALGADIANDNVLTAIAEGGGAPSSEGPTVRPPGSPELTIPTPEVTRTGSCFIASPNGDVITAHHVIEGSSRIDVRLSNDNIVRAVLARHARTTDLALLRVDGQTPEFLVLAPPRSTKSGDRVFTIGFPAPNLLGTEAKLADGVISAMSGPGGESTLVQFTVPIQPGSSGSPLLDESGKVVAVVTSAAAAGVFLRVTGALPQNIGWGINADYVRPLLPETRGSSFASRTDAIAHAKQAVCQVLAYGQGDASSDHGRSIDGEWSGTVVNESHQIYASARMNLVERSGSLSGFLDIRVPLFGSGPLTGSIDGEKISFTSRGDFVISWKGEVSDSHHISGDYRVLNTGEIGRWTMHRE